MNWTRHFYPGLHLRLMTCWGGRTGFVLNAHSPLMVTKWTFQSSRVHSQSEPCRANVCPCSIQILSPYSENLNLSNTFSIICKHMIVNALRATGRPFTMSRNIFHIFIYCMWADQTKYTHTVELLPLLLIIIIKDAIFLLELQREKCNHFELGLCVYFRFSHTLGREICCFSHHQ